jgi:hypothetical protein
MIHQIPFLFLALFNPALGHSSGQSQLKKRHRETPEPKFAEFAQATPQKDTLYLVENHEMSSLIAKTWNSDTSGTPPKIIMVTKENMICIKTRCNKRK